MPWPQPLVENPPMKDAARVVYLAGPMTGVLHYNYEAFAEMTENLRMQGFFVFNPAEQDISSGFNPIGCHGGESKAELKEKGFDLRKALAADLDFIAQAADIVAVLPGWEGSKGVAAEIALADALGLPVVKAESLFCDAKWSDVEYDLLRDAEIPQPKVTYGFAHIADPIAPKLSELAKGLKESAKLMDGGALLTVSQTGGQKGSKEARYDLIPVKPLEYLARLYGKGAEKYDDNNWAKGYDWKYSYAAMQRHANQFWAGEDNDPEMELPHLASVAWHAFTMMYFMEHYPQYDSRMTEPPTS